MQRFLKMAILMPLLLTPGIAGAEAPLPIAGKTARPFMSVRGLTDPPSGYVSFCRRHPSECADAGARTAAMSAGRVSLTPARWRELASINASVNRYILPRTDAEIYGRTEYWTYPDLEGRGDCEDYVLLKRRLLLERGWPQNALLITVVLDEFGEGHAVLTVRTAQGDFILDNKHSRILRWSETPYHFIKRQSYRNPALWVSLVPAPEGPEVGAASSGE